MRRDNCQLVRTVVSTCLDKILIEEDIEGAKDYVRRTISDLLMNRMDLSLLVITKVRKLMHGCNGDALQLDQITALWQACMVTPYLPKQCTCTCLSCSAMSE